MSDTFTLTAVIEAPNQSEVDRLVAELEANEIEIPATIAAPDASEVTSAVDEIEGESIEMQKPVVPAPDTTAAGQAVDDLRLKGDQTSSVMANMTGNVAGELGELAGAAGPTSVALGQLAEYAADGNVSLAGLAASAGPMLALTAAVEIGTRAWKAYTDKSNLTKKTTQEVSDALTEQSGVLNEVSSALDDLIEAGTATGWDRLNQALLEGLDEGEVKKITGALGDLGMTFEDLSPSIAAIEGDTDDARAGMERLAAQGGIPEQYVASIAAAVHAGEDMGKINSALRQSYQEQGLSIEDAQTAADHLTDTYGDQIAALEQLNDAQQNSDVQKIAQDQLDVAKGATVASAAMVAAAEAAAGPDASALDIWQEYIRLQNEAAQAAEDAAEAAEIAAQSAEGAVAFASAINSVDWKSADIAGAETAMSAFTETLFAAGNEAQAQAEAYADLSAAIGDTGLQFNTTTEAGMAQQDAIEQLAASIDTELADAFAAADGSFEDFAASAEATAQTVRDTLVNDLGLTTDEADKVLQAMGLLDGKDIEARFNLSGAEEARLKLGLLSSAITGLPPDVERAVNLAVTAGDYTAALTMIQDYYAANEPETVAQVTADAKQYSDEVSDAVREAEGSYTVVPVTADTDDAEEEIEETADNPPQSTIPADADTTEAASQLLDEASRHRTATIYALADFTSAKTVLDSLTNPRVAKVTANAWTSDAERELNNTARARTSVVYQRVVSVGGTGGGWGGSGRAAPAGLSATASAAPMPAPISVQINAAVIGDAYSVQRAVTRAMRGAVRLSGARYARAGAAA